MALRPFSRLALALLGGCLLSSFALAQQAPNTLTSQQKQEGWQLLFNGKNFDGWHSFGQKGVAKDWTIDNGAIRLKKAKGENQANSADLTTNGEYGNFDFMVEWKAEPCVDSGLMFHVHESAKYHQPYETGPEMQIADYACTVPDSRTLYERSGDMFGLIADPYEWVKPAGQWNNYEIKVYNNHVQFFTDGHKVVDTQIGDPAWKNLVAHSKFAGWPGFADYNTGHISLQGSEVKGKSEVKVWFRDIMIRKL